MQSEYIITILSVITAGLSPMVLTYMNHRHDVKIRGLELKTAVQQSVEIDFNKSKAEALRSVKRRTSTKRRSRMPKSKQLRRRTRR